MPNLLAESTIEETMKEVNRLKSAGADDARAWTTAMFYHDAVIKRMFVHHKMGLKNKKDMKNIISSTLAFGGLGAKNRAMSAVKNETFVFAHDHPIRRGEDFFDFTGAKMYLTLSAWQLLASFTKMPQERQAHAWQFFWDKGVMSKKKLESMGRKDLVADGQLLDEAPMSSLYVERGVNFGEGCYVFNLDIDGKVCMSRDGRENRDEKEGAEIMRLFEYSTGGEPSRLVQISHVLKETLLEFFASDHFEPRVSWHKSLGWKPSWRGYVLGPLFKSVEVARVYFEAKLLPALEKKSWYVKGLLDSHSYHKGVDRCLGSAKFETTQGSEFRFLSPSPLDEVSDKISKDLMVSCPNEYILRCLGLIYPRGWNGESLSVPEKASLFTSSHPKKKKRFDVDKELTPSTGDVLVGITREALADAKFIKKWNGYVERTSRCFGETKVYLRAIEPHAFCIFKHRKGEKHDSVNAKIVFKISLPDAGVARLWQTCFSCESEKSAYVLTFKGDLVNRLRAALPCYSFPEEKKTCLEYADLSLFILPIRLHEGVPPFKKK